MVLLVRVNEFWRGYKPTIMKHVVAWNRCGLWVKKIQLLSFCYNAAGM